MKIAYFLHENRPLASLQEGDFFIIMVIKGVNAMYIHFNENPCGKNNGDCVIRAISIVTGMSWRKVYAGLSLQGYMDCGWGNFNSIWADYLLYLGFSRYTITANYRYTVANFAAEHPDGAFILGTGTHAVAVVDGNIIDSWYSGDEIPLYYFKKDV